MARPLFTHIPAFERPFVAPQQDKGASVVLAADTLRSIVLLAAKLLVLEPPQIDLFWVVPERHHRPRSPQEGPFPGWVPVLNRKKTQMGLQGGLRKSGYFLIPTLMLNLKVKIAADGTKNGILPD